MGACFPQPAMQTGAVDKMYNTNNKNDNTIGYAPHLTDGAL